MDDNRDDEAFWPSYVDVMTGLFLVMLVLFVFSYRALTTERDRLKVSADSYKRLQDIDAAIKELGRTSQFKYEPKFKRYVLTKQIQFTAGDATIDSSYGQFLVDTGKSLSDLVAHLKADPSKRGIRYLIIIEGMASRDAYPDNFGLSYRRALALYKFWQQQHITFDPSICEVLIAGSGTEGVGRYTGHEEAKNQRFLIQIVPKVAY